MPQASETNEIQERVILVGVCLEDGDDTMDSLDELAELVKTAGAISVGSMIQNRQSIHPGLYIGTGKVQELQDMIREENATGIVCDDELSPAQLRNLTLELGVKVMDRTLIILDIFAARASTSEGKIQVELAQLRYRASRLTGLGRSMSRLGGGIGTRGPGEKKLEIDRRRIGDRISRLKQELEEMEHHRQINRAARVRGKIPVAAIVGYTNAGKSTLLNALTDAGIPAEDKLFATLDPTTRILELPRNQRLLLTDTVGFIRKLPHHLVEAFRSTLEEAKYADIILHVVDASNPQAAKQMHIVYETLHRLGIEGKRVITLFNKTDVVTEAEPLRDGRADAVLRISARRGTGLNDLREKLSDALRESRVYVECLIPYECTGMLQQIRTCGELLREEYLPEGTAIEAYVSREIYGRLGSLLTSRS